MRAKAENGIPHYVCPVDLTLDLIGHKWQPLILWELATGPLHYNAIQAALPGVAHKVLTQQLRDLEQHDLVWRNVRQDRGGRRVEYALSKFGQTLRPVLRVMSEWAKQNHQRVGVTIDSRCLRERIAATMLPTPGAPRVRPTTSDRAGRGRLRRATGQAAAGAPRATPRT